MKDKIILAGIVVLISFIVYGFTANKSVRYTELKGAPQGLSSVLAIATTTVVGPQENKTIFSSGRQCTSRIISTVAQPIMITFGDPVNGDLSSTTLSGSIGHTQLASTTIAYDAGIYGCGRWSAYGYASSTITTVEMR